jgi:DNA polymerase-3 subunit alpha
MFVATDPGTIRYGLGAVKGVGQGVCEAIVAARTTGGPFRDLLDFCQRVSAAGLNKRTLEALILAGAMDALAINRASLMLQLPEALKASEQMAKNRETGMFDMFGGSTAIHVELPTTSEWPLSQRLQGERDTLGLYFSGHPIDPYYEDLVQLVGHDLSMLDALLERGNAGPRPSDGRNWRPQVQVVVAGQVVNIRKRGESQAFVQLEDGRGRLECAFFAEQWDEFAPLVTRDRLLVVEGGLREDEFNGGYALRAMRCWDFAQICQHQSQRIDIHIDLRVEGAWPRLDAVLKQHAGPTPVLLTVTTPAGSGRLHLNHGRGLRVDVELPSLLRHLPGVSTVRLHLARPWAGQS